MSDELFKYEDCDRYGSMPNISSEIAGAGLTGCYQERCLSLATANRLHRKWLAKGTVVYGAPGDGWMDKLPDKGSLDDWYTHTAIVLNIRAIEPADSAERLLADLANYTGHNTYMSELVERARKLLNRGNK